MIEREKRAEIERCCSYITDDGAIASYCDVPRFAVAVIRSRIRPRRSPERSNLVLPIRHGNTEDAELMRRKTTAELANEAHLRALLDYGTRYALPNISADECARRLAEL